MYFGEKLILLPPQSVLFNFFLIDISDYKTALSHGLGFSSGSFAGALFCSATLWVLLHIPLRGTSLWTPNIPSSSFPLLLFQLQRAVRAQLGPCCYLWHKSIGTKYKNKNTRTFPPFLKNSYLCTCPCWLCLLGWQGYTTPHRRVTYFLGKGIHLNFLYWPSSLKAHGVVWMVLLSCSWLSRGYSYLHFQRGYYNDAKCS